MNIGDRMKQYENLQKGKLLPNYPIIARIDGRAFHTVTRKCQRPYDEELSELMQITTICLMEETDAKVGYTQSDEISLLFYPQNEKSQTIFNGNKQKLDSVLASIATYSFLTEAAKLGKSDSKLLERLTPPFYFDARSFNVFSKEEVFNYFLWRELDATKNSISMAAQAYYSHKELHGKNSSDKQEMLFQRGVNWNNYPSFFKRGQYFRKTKASLPFSADEIAKLPEKHEARKNPELKVERNVISIWYPPLLTKIENKNFFFEEL